MATRNIVPRATGEGQIGTSAKTWSAGYFNDIAVTNGVTAATFTGDLTGDVTGDVTGNVTGDVTGDVTGNADTATNATNDANGNPIAGTYLPLAGGTMTGTIRFGDKAFIQNQSTASGLPYNQIMLGYGNPETVDGTEWYEGGAKISLHSVDANAIDGDGYFSIIATSRAIGQSSGVSKTLRGKSDGTLTWESKAIIVGNEYSQTFTTNKLAANAEQNFTLTAQPKYWSVICNTGSGWSGLLFAVNGGKSLRVTNKSTSTLPENVNFTINYIA